MNEILDNRYLTPIEYNGIIYPSVENAFQSSRFKDPSIKRKFITFTPHEAAYRGNHFITTIDDWQHIKHDIMYQLLRKKFENPILKKALLDTKDSSLVITNNVHDNEWGSCTCRICNNSGENKVGIMLMELRNEFQRSL